MAMATIRTEMFRLQTTLRILGVRAEIREISGLGYALVEPGSPDHHAIFGRPPRSPFDRPARSAFAEFLAQLNPRGR